jgi:hypothetical protein
MATRLARIRAIVRTCLGPIDHAEDDVLRVLDGSAYLLPVCQPERRQVAREAARALENGWRRGSGRQGLRRALRRAAELDENRPTDVAVELRELHVELLRVIDEDPSPFD